MAATRVTVGRDALIEAIQAEKAKVLDDHVKAKAEYVKKLQAWEKDVLAQLKHYVTHQNLIAGLDGSDSRKRYVHIPTHVVRPLDPGPAPDTKRFDGRIKMLKASTRDELSLDESGWATYLR